MTAESKPGRRKRPLTPYRRMQAQKALDFIIEKGDTPEEDFSKFVTGGRTALIERIADVRRVADEQDIAVPNLTLGGQQPAVYRAMPKSEVQETLQEIKRKNKEARDKRKSDFEKNKRAAKRATRPPTKLQVIQDTLNAAQGDFVDLYPIASGFYSDNPTEDLVRNRLSGIINNARKHGDRVISVMRDGKALYAKEKDEFEEERFLHTKTGEKAFYIGRVGEKRHPTLPTVILAQNEIDIIRNLSWDVPREVSDVLPIIYSGLSPKARGQRLRQEIARIRDGLAGTGIELKSARRGSRWNTESAYQYDTAPAERALLKSDEHDFLNHVLNGMTRARIVSEMFPKALTPHQINSRVTNLISRVDAKLVRMFAIVDHVRSNDTYTYYIVDALSGNPIDDRTRKNIDLLIINSRIYIDWQRNEERGAKPGLITGFSIHDMHLALVRTGDFDATFEERVRSIGRLSGIQIGDDGEIPEESFNLIRSVIIRAENMERGLEKRPTRSDTTVRKTPQEVTLTPAEPMDITLGRGAEAAVSKTPPFTPTQLFVWAAVLKNTKMLLTEMGYETTRQAQDNWDRVIKYTTKDAQPEDPRKILEDLETNLSKMTPQEIDEFRSLSEENAALWEPLEAGGFPAHYNFNRLAEEVKKRLAK